MSKLTYFNKKDTAIKYWSKNDETYLFQIDKINGKIGSKQFIVGTLDDIWVLISSGKIIYMNHGKINLYILD